MREEKFNAGKERDYRGRVMYIRFGDVLYIYRDSPKRSHRGSMLVSLFRCANSADRELKWTVRPKQGGQLTFWISTNATFR